MSIYWPFKIIDQGQSSYLLKKGCDVPFVPLVPMLQVSEPERLRQWEP